MQGQSPEPSGGQVWKSPARKPAAGCHDLLGTKDGEENTQGCPYVRDTVLYPGPLDREGWGVRMTSSLEAQPPALSRGPSSLAPPAPVPRTWIFLCSSCRARSFSETRVRVWRPGWWRRLGT